MNSESLSYATSDALLLAVLDSIGKGIIVVNGKILYCNNVAETVLGYKAGELKERTAQEIFTVDMQLLNSCVFKEVYDCQAAGEFRFKTAEGFSLPLKCEIKAITFEDKKAYLIVFEKEKLADIQTQKLAETERLFRILTEKSFVGIYIYKEKFIYANPEYLSKVGYSLDELKQMSPWEVIHEKDRKNVKENVKRRLAGEVFDKKYNERQVITKSGKKLTFRVATNTVLIDGEFAGIGSTIDISDLKDLQNGLEEKVKEETNRRSEQEQLLIQQSKLAEMGAMLSSIAHQWKQPLSAVSMLIQDLARTFDSEKLDKEYIDWVHDTATEQIAYMTETVKDFMSFLRPSKERSPFSIGEAIWPALKIFSHQVSVNELIIEMYCDGSNKNTACKTTNILSSQNGKADCEICKRSDLSVDGYKNEFMQVLLNLLNNAKDAINTAKLNNLLHESGKIIIRVSLDSEYVSIEIEDNGGGIPEDHIHRVFEPYFTTKDKEQGTGIGLYMVRAITENSMGGKISVRNSENGAVFKILMNRSVKN